MPSSTSSSPPTPSPSPPSSLHTLPSSELHTLSLSSSGDTDSVHGEKVWRCVGESVGVCGVWVEKGLCVCVCVCVCV